MTDIPGRAPRRRFSVFDVMFLVATVALALAWVGRTTSRGWILEPGFLKLRLFGGPWTILRVLMRVPLVFETALPFLLLVTFAFFVIRLRPPRPAFNLLIRQSGTIICIVAILALFVAMLNPVLIRLATERRFVSPASRSIDPSGTGPLDLLTHALVDSAPFAGFAVTGTWVALALARRSPYDPDWIDRLGRALGVAWICAVPADVGLHIVSVLQCRGQW